MQSIIKPYFQIITPTGTSEEGRGTLVAFSALARSVNKFCFYKSSYEGRVARLMLNCNRTWYLEGIPEFSTNVENTAEKIQNQLKASGNEGSLFIGSSMGGFGALFYGSICNAKRIICFATEVIANIPGGRRQLNPTSPYVNLKAFIERSQSVIDLFIGECNPADIFSAFYLKNLANTKIHLIANSGHNVVNDLKNKRVLVEIVNLGLTNSKIELAKNIYSSSKLYKFLNSYDYDPTYSNFVKFIDIYIKFYLDNKTDISSQNYIELIKFVCIATKHDSNFNTLLKSIVEKFLLDDQICTDSQQYLDLLVSLYGAAKIDSQLNIKILNIIKKAELEIACITPEILLYEPKANYRLGNYDAVINLKGLENYPEYQYWRANAAIKINNNKIAAEAAKAGYILIQTHPKKGESAYIGLANALHQLIQSRRISHYGTSTLLGT